MTASLETRMNPSIELEKLVNYCDTLLNAHAFRDYAPNGLQVQGKTDVQVVVSGVTACQALIDEAIARKADALLVHHGYFWKNEPAPIVGMKGERIAKLIKHDMNLIAYHLPLDAHTELGNNAQLGMLLGVTDVSVIGQGGAEGLLFTGKLSKPMSAQAFADTINEVLNRMPTVIPPRDNHTIERIAWCSGGAQGFFDQAVTAGVDAYISGEISEPNAHIARESNVAYFAIGHHASERYGVKALGEHLADQFGLVHHFVDIDNPA